jgi:hypothetical protein
MFYDKPECQILSSHVDAYGTKSGIFLFKNVLPEDLMQKVEKQNAKINLEKAAKETEVNLISWYTNKVLPPVDGSFEIWKTVSEVLYPEYVIHPQIGMLSVKPGDGGMFVHSDSPGKHQCHLLSQDDRWSTCCLLDFGAVAYLGNFTGGAIFYPGINPDGTVKEDDNRQDGCFEYTPERGDLVIHSAFEPYSHGVREVESGTRYAFSIFSLKAIDNPGTFYNYKTKEYFDQIKDESEENIRIWSTPLKTNPQFPKEKLIEMKKSGLEGTELSSAFFKQEDFTH